MLLRRFQCLAVVLIASFLSLSSHRCSAAKPPAGSKKQAADNKADNKADESATPTKQPEKWNVESPPGKPGTQAIDVTEGTWINLDVSPDGQTIAFDLLGDLYLMAIGGADGTASTDKQVPRRLTSGIAWDMQPRFSPDGQWIAFTSDRTGKNDQGGDNLWIIGVDGQGLTQVTSESYRLLNGPIWTPDGEYLVARKHFTSRRSLGSGEMWMYHRDALALGATAGVQLTKKPNAEKDVNEPAFSPDGKYLYYSQDTTPGGTFEYDKDSHKGIYSIKRLELESGETETLISGPGGACRPVPSPDGRSLAFVRRVGAKTGLHIYDLRSGAIRLIYDQLERDMQETWAIHGVYSAMAWTPDNQSIVVWAKGKIRRIDVATGTASVIPFHIQDQRQTRAALRFPVSVAPGSFDVKMLRSVVTSPDSSAVAFQALGHIYVRQLPEGKPRRLTRQNDHFEFCPSFSRDGKYIVYSTWNDQSLGSVRVASIDPTSGDQWTVTSEPGHYIQPVFSPDGSRIVFERRGGGHLTSPLWSQNPGIYQIALHDGTARRITRSGASPHFADDSDRVFFTETESSPESDHRKLCSIGLDGTEKRVHYTSDWATELMVSPDRRQVAFVERFNVYLAPFVQTGSPIAVGPDGKGVPIRKLSDQAGDFVHFSSGSRKLHWSLGPDYFSVDIERKTRDDSGARSDSEDDAKSDSDDDAKSDAKSNAKADAKSNAKADAKSDSEADAEPARIRIGFRHPYARPRGMTAIKGARIVTMDKAGVIDNGVVLIKGDRIVRVGPVGKVKIPDQATVIEAQGQVVTPGFIDVHAHGAMASDGITPQQNWLDIARLAFGVTTIHDPSNDTHSIFAASELAKAGRIAAPRIFSTGKILYGATGAAKAQIDSLDDAMFHLQRMKAVGAFSVKSYNQPRRDQRQQVIAAARKLNMMVVPEGGATFMHNLTMIVDGHTGIEHTLPVQSAYDDVMDLWRGTGVGYTPTLNVAYGGLGGENFWYQTSDLWAHPRLKTFIPPHILNPRSHRRLKAPREDYNHIKVAQIARQVVDDGGLVQAGGHGQLPGICTHWELKSFVQGGMTPIEALTCGTINGARYLGLDKDLGSIAPGKLADLVIYDAGADPTQNINHSEKIQTVIAGGFVYEAQRMNRHGSPSPRPPAFWNQPGASPSRMYSIDAAVGCSCGRCQP